jgi:hypothetical protein
MLKDINMKEKIYTIYNIKSGLSNKALWDILRNDDTFNLLKNIRTYFYRSIRFDNICSSTRKVLKETK